METTRQQKINRLLQKELGDIFLRQAQQMNGILVSVTAVKITSDLSIARIYLSIFPSNKGKELVENIKTNTKALRFELGKKVGKQLRIIPHLTFFLDDSLDYLERIDELLKPKNNNTNESSN